METLQIEKNSCQISLEEYRREYQDVEKFQGYCAKCRNFGQQWVCPPFDFDLNAILDQYSMVDIFGYKMLLPERLLDKKFSMEEQREIGDMYMTQVRAIIDPELWDLEQQHPGSRAFYAGSCHLCDPYKCTRVAEKPAPCRHPLKARNSLENFGFDLKRTAEELLDTPMLWGRDGMLPPYYFFIAALMY